MSKVNRKLYVEVADTQSKREIGLMHRKYLPYNEGMLFKFSGSSTVSFWMKNTYIPLDIAFIKHNGEIFQIEYMSPLSTRQIYSKYPCKYALEVNHGWFSDNDVKVGSKLKGLFFGRIISTAQVAQDLNNVDKNKKEEDINPEVILNFSIRDKLKYSEQHGLKLKILYNSKNGHMVGPRVLSPVKEEGNTYPIERGELGEYFKAFDESPTITGDSYVVEGLRIKSYFFSGIRSLEILDKNGNVLNTIKGQPVDSEHEEVDNKENVKLNEEDVKLFFKKSIPKFTDDQWNLIREEVMSNLKRGYGIEDIVDNVKEYILQWLFKWKKRK